MASRYPFIVGIEIGPGAVHARTKVSDVISSASLWLPARYIANRKTSVAYFWYRELKSVIAGRNFSVQQACGNICPSMCNNSWPETLAPQSHESEQCAIALNGTLCTLLRHKAMRVNSVPLRAMVKQARNP